jgi:hypothetical protein
MIKPLLEFCKIINDNKQKFSNKGLSGDFFIDIYRSQPQEPELYEYFSLPALFVDYSMQGQGKNQPRLVNLSLHILTDEMPDASNISDQQQAGLNRFLYLIMLQSILEGCRLGKTSTLEFLTETIIDAPVVNYHVQTYQFEAYLSDMMDNVPDSLGEIANMEIFGRLVQRLW